MVLDRLYDVHYLRKHKWLVFLLSLSCTVFSIFSSLILFHGNASLITLTFIGLLLHVTLGDFIRIILPSRVNDEKKLALIEYKEIVALFTLIFLGIIVPFCFYSVLLPEQAASYLFTSQYELMHTQSATELFTYGTISSIFFNNLIVFGVSFITAFLFGLGGIYFFIVIWNASLLGVVFGIVARHTAQSNSINAFFILLIIFLAALPHIFLEIYGYFLSGITGERLSDWLFFKKLNKKILLNEIIISLTFIAIGIGLIFIGAIFEKIIASTIISLIL